MSLTQNRDVALYELKLKAAQQAGGYIVRTTKIDQYGISDSVEIISASLVRLSDIHERIITIDKDIAIRLSGRAEVDLDSAKERLHYLMENRELREELNRQGNALSRLLLDKPANYNYALITESQSKISRLITSAEQAMLIRQNEQVLAKIKHEVVDATIDIIFKRSHLSATVETIKDHGDYYEYYVRVSFLPPLQEINSIVSRVWETRLRNDEENPYLLINGGALSSKIITAQGANDIYNDLFNKSISIKVEIGTNTIYIPALYAGNSFRPGCKINLPEDVSKNMCLTSITQKSSGPLNTSAYSNPVTITVPKKNTNDDILVNVSLVLTKT